MSFKKNKNRGYQQLRVWKDAVDLYKLNYSIVRKFSYELRRVSSQAIASCDSVHRNIAEGYCRKSIKEYIQYLYIALSSLGESVSGWITYKTAGHITEEEFEQLDTLAYKLENGMLKLIERLEQKKESHDWIDNLIIKEINTLYGEE